MILVDFVLLRRQRSSSTQSDKYPLNSFLLFGITFLAFIVDRSFTIHLTFFLFSFGTRNGMHFVLASKRWEDLRLQFRS
jgi:hypothetical protein